MCQSINNIAESSVNVNYCPYCGGVNIECKSEFDCCCEDCGRDFKIMTHE